MVALPAAASAPSPATSILVPSNGAALSGTTTLDASVSNATSVEFRLFGGTYGFSGPVLCTATLTLYGWLCSWNTTSVPNGSYVLESEAFNSTTSAFSSGVTITVANPAATPTPKFVQINSATPLTPQTSVPVTFNASQMAGDTNVVVVGFDGTTSTIRSVTDSTGNIYHVAAPLTRGSEDSEAIYYAPNILGATARANTVTVTFSAATSYPDIRIVEYANLASTNPVDGTSSKSGTGSPVVSGNVATTTANDLIFGAGTTEGVYTGTTDGSTVRLITSPDADIVADRTVMTTGSYGFSAAQTTGGDTNSVTQVVAFRAGTAPVRVMPLGDSITDGYLTPGGYRTELWQLLVNQDDDNINFVGSQSTGALAPGDLTSSGNDEGHVGWCIGLDNSTCEYGDDLSSDIVGWLTTYQPNIILLHAGTNDISSGDTGAQVTTNMDDFLEQIFTTLPHTDVLLAQIIPILNVQPESNYSSMETAWQAYNAAIPGLVTKYQDMGYNIQLVNMSDVLNPDTDYATGAANPQDDDFHPNLAGYDIMAQTWYPFVKALYSTF
jgi:lysophospholipase L1-like esterase